jgi:hypothetical protein
VQRAPARAPASKPDPLQRLSCVSSEIPSYERKMESPKRISDFIAFQCEQKLTIDVSQSRTRNPDADDGKNAAEDVFSVDNNARVSIQLLL